MKIIKNVLILFVLIGLGSGCAISRNVMPVDSDVTIDKIFVLENEQVHMDEMDEEIVAQIRELGFESESYIGDRPDEARYYLTYTANWTWDMAMYLTYFSATLYDDGRVLGEADYDARSGGANPAKFGKTANKIRPLIEQLLSKVERVP